MFEPETMKKSRRVHCVSREAFLAFTTQVDATKVFSMFVTLHTWKWQY